MKITAPVVPMLCALVLPLWSFQAPQGEARIFESMNRVGDFTLGAPIQQYLASVKLIGASRYQSRTRDIFLFTDGAGRVDSIMVSQAGMFTQRLITIGQSTMTDVLQRYGKTQSLTRTGGSIVLQYDGLSFSFDDSPNNKVDALRRPVASVTIRRTRKS